MNSSPAELYYESGETIKKGDRVLFHGNAATIEFVADGLNPENDWYIQEFGGGVMILDPICSGHTFIPPDQSQEYSYLELLSRA